MDDDRFAIQIQYGRHVQRVILWPGDDPHGVVQQTFRLNCPVLAGEGEYPVAGMQSRFFLPETSGQCPGEVRFL